MSDQIEIIEPPKNVLATVARNEIGPSISLPPVEIMVPLLDEYSKRRDGFRAWLFSKLVKGVHYRSAARMRAEGERGGPAG